MDAISNCSEIVAEDTEKAPFVGRQLLEVRERISELAVLKLYDLYMEEHDEWELDKLLDR